ncbi:MAG: BlaI/MecI/CopY family transcriptional regulator [Bacteroidaceae bacterium]|nr:BlaI/MecI/CopY family transcriptional regulator [Bacteroidaceae bacterium]
MKTLTDKELEIMNVLWDKGAMSMRELHENMPEPRSHFNTVSTVVRRLEEQGFINHVALGARFFHYEAAISREAYNVRKQKSFVERFFDGSYMNFVSQLVKDEDISIEELKELIRMVEEK